MPVYNICVGACDLGQVDAASEQEARDLAAQMVGYDSEAELRQELDEESAVMARLVE